MRSISLISLLLFTFHANGQRVSGVTAEQQGQDLVISYGLEPGYRGSPDPWFIALAGSSCQRPATALRFGVVDRVAGRRSATLLGDGRCANCARKTLPFRHHLGTEVQCIGAQVRAIAPYYGTQGSFSRHEQGLVLQFGEDARIEQGMHVEALHFSIGKGQFQQVAG